MPTLAADTRETVRKHPFVLDALRAGIVNFTAAARFLDLDGDDAAVAAALRRFADDLDEYQTESRSARVSMQSGLGFGDGDDALFSFDAVSLTDGGDLTALLATGEIDAHVLGAVLQRFRVEGVPADAAAVVDGSLLVVVEKRHGANALRELESALSVVPR